MESRLNIMPINKTFLTILFCSLAGCLSAQWQYDTILVTDTNYVHRAIMASCVSQDTVFISRPEIELVQGTLIVVTLKKKNYVMLFVSRARIEGSAKDSTLSKMEFDDDAPFDYSYT